MAYEYPQIMPIQIRPNLIIRIQGIPHDLTAAEAGKIVRVIEALVERAPDRRTEG